MSRGGTDQRSKEKVEEIFNKDGELVTFGGAAAQKGDARTNTHTHTQTNKHAQTH
jgi:hypothetical protein